MKFRILVIFVLLVRLLLCQEVIASEKYCSAEGKKIDIHLFGFTFEGDAQKKLALKGVTDLRNSFKVGDRIKVFAYTANDYGITIDACVPGCPEKKFSEQLFSSECSVMVAKRDYQNFQNQFNKKVTGQFKTGSNDYDIFESIQSLADSYRSSEQKKTIFAVISLIPKGVDPKSAAQLNKLYVQKRETIKFPTSFPSVRLIGNSTDQELIAFWTDVFRGRANFEFDKY